MSRIGMMKKRPGTGEPVEAAEPQDDDALPLISDLDRVGEN